MTIIEDGDVYTRDNGLPILKDFVISWRKKKVHPQGWKREGLKNVSKWFFKNLFQIFHKNGF